MADKDHNITYNRETKVVNASFLEHVWELRLKWKDVETMEPATGCRQTVM